MVLKLRLVSETYKAKVYTEDGYLLGEVEEALIYKNKIYGWKIKVLDPDLIKRGIKGIIVQHSLVKAMGQIWIVSRAVYSVKTPEEYGIKEKAEEEQKVEVVSEEEKKSE